MVDDLPKQKTMPSIVSVEVMLDLRGRNALTSRNHSLVVCLVYEIQ